MLYEKSYSKVNRKLFTRVLIVVEVVYLDVGLSSILFVEGENYSLFVDWIGT